MKKIFTLLTTCLMTIVGAAQVSVITGPGYENQVWYSLSEGEVGIAPLNNWDLAFEISGFTSSIRANTQKGLKVYQTPYAISAWDGVDTTGMANEWPRLYNDITNWSRGAFNLNSTSDFDLGWGMYNIITHTIAGDSLYVVELANGTYKKLRIDALASGVYTLTAANLDGSQETTIQVDKDDFTGKNFGYVNLESGEVLDREPLSATWDLTFVKYTVDLNGTAYPVSGVLQNYDVVTADVSETPIGEANPWMVGFNSEIDEIGYDWKTFDFSAGWVLDEERSFFVQALDGNVYQIIFTGFGGTATGEYQFNAILSSPLNTETINTEAFGLFPNPSSGDMVSFTGTFGPEDRLEIFNLQGKLVSESRIQQSNSFQMSVGDLTSGTYLIRLVSERGIQTQKLIIQK